jgi:pimeloyl-ACP methyl ester carboxylesterase
LTSPVKSAAFVATIGLAAFFAFTGGLHAQAGVASGTAVEKANVQTSAWRYDLRPGDHLIYRYTTQRQSQDKDEQFKVEARFRTHVMVVAADAERISLGFQRNREAAELTESRSKGKDNLARAQADFQKRMQKRPSQFSEAMEISPAGEPRHSWEVARETPIRYIDFFHEVMNLPLILMAMGEVWRNSPLLGLDLTWVDDVSIHGKLCHHIEGILPNGALKLSYWWSPESGALEQVALDGNYQDKDSTLHETARMELESKLHGERLEAWLASADTRQGALQAVLLTPGVPVSSEQLSPALTSDDSASQALALAIASRQKIEIPPGILSKLRQSGSDLVKLLTDPPSDFSSPQTDECRRVLPEKPQPVKYGTAIESAPATKEYSEIPYLLRVPLTYHGSSGRPAPLLVYLSGGAGFAIDGVNTAEDAVAGTDYLVLYPQATGFWWTSETARRFDTILNNVLQRYNVDRERIYLAGYSNGATGALYFATLWPHRFAAVVSLMGAGQCENQVKAGLPNLRNLPLLFVHGENDPLISPDCSTVTSNALSEPGTAIQPQLKILPDRAHDITLQSDDNLTLAFFKGKLRNPFPREVEINLSDALAGRGYWIEIINGTPGKSHLEARVKASNTIEIHSREVKSIRLHLRPEILPKPGDFSIVWNGKKLYTGPLHDRCSQPYTGDPKLDQADTRDLELP